jgi:hypothetical protein
MTPTPLGPWIPDPVVEVAVEDACRAVVDLQRDASALPLMPGAREKPSPVAVEDYAGISAHAAMRLHNEAL